MKKLVKVYLTIAEARQAMLDYGYNYSQADQMLQKGIAPVFRDNRQKIYFDKITNQYFIRKKSHNAPQSVKDRQCRNCEAMNGRNRKGCEVCGYIL